VNLAELGYPSQFKARLFTFRNEARWLQFRNEARWLHELLTAGETYLLDWLEGVDKLPYGPQVQVDSQTCVILAPVS
jgi:hypothetical protein